MPETIVQAATLITSSVVFIVAVVLFLALPAEYTDLTGRQKFYWWLSLAGMVPSFLFVLFIVGSKIF